MIMIMIIRNVIMLFVIMQFVLSTIRMMLVRGGYIVVNILKLITVHNLTVW